MKKTALIIVAVTLCSFQAKALPTGAPSLACTTLIPRHAPNQAGSAFPYHVDLSRFASSPSGFVYEGGKRYRST